MNNRGFAPVIAVLVLAGVLILGGIGYYAVKKFQAPGAPAQQIVGGDKDVHGCIGSAGYSWCEVKQKCLRIWEEKCELVEMPKATSTPMVNQEKSVPIIKSSFSQPYPVIWQDRGGYGSRFTYSITGAALGNVVFPKNVSRFSGPAFGQLTTSTVAGNGDVHYALVLYLKVHRADDDNGPVDSCAPLGIRRLISEEGDFVLPNTLQFTFSSGCALEPGVTYTDRPVVFTVSSTEKDFTFATGNASSTFFEVKVQNNIIKVLPEPTEG